MRSKPKVNIDQGEKGWKLTVGIFHGHVGFQTEQAAGVKASGLERLEAIKQAEKLQKWIDKQAV